MSNQVVVETFVEGFHNAEATNRMQYNTLGNTGMHVSQLGFGTSSIGGCFGDIDLEHCYEVVDFVIRSGINYIDTAPWYGQGKAEKYLGEALRIKKIPRQSFYLASKVGRYEKEIDKMFDFSAERVTKSIDESLRRIGVEYFDLIQVHDMEFAPSLDIIINETLPALQKAKDAGKVRFIGITGYPLENFRTVLDRSTVHIDTILSYCHYSMNNTALLEYIPYLKSKGVGIINAAPTSMGLLTNQGPPTWHPAQDEIKDACKEAVTFSKDQGIDIATLALKFSCNNADITTTIVGTDRMTHMVNNIDAVTTPISEKEEQVMSEIRERYFKKLNNLTWGSSEVETYRKALDKINCGEPLNSDDCLG